MQENKSQEPEQLMFNDPTDEELLCQILKALVEEWGYEHIIVTVPTLWQEYSKTGSLGQVRLDFTEEKSVGIRVRYKDPQTGVEAILDRVVELRNA